jgi:hypothetical protein
MPDHSYFEELAALSAGGHLSRKEASDLREHLAGCLECRENAEAYREIVVSGLPLTRTAVSVQHERATASPDAGARDRFLARARHEGIHFSPEVETRTAPVRWSLAYRVAAALAFTTIIIGSAFFVPDISRRLASSGNVQQELDRIRQENARLTETLTARDQALTEQQQQLRTLQAQIDAAAKAGNDTRRDGAQAGFQLGQSRSLEARLLEELQNRDQQLAAAAEEIARINQLRVTDQATLDAQVTRLRDVSNQLRIARATVDMERELSAAGRDILELMAAKQLRVVDVRDTDASGRPSAAFARVFISEGRTIRIFAFDLNEGTAPPGGFQVWGEQVGDAKSVRSLGTLSIDDRTQNRWSLTIQNGAVVKDINSVFVTTSGRGSAPSGPRLLYAFLGRS